LYIGIGKCIAFELAKQGNTKIIINDIASMMDEANAVAKEIRDMGVDAIALAADCSNQEDIKQLFKEIINHYGRCDVLVVSPDDWYSQHGTEPAPYSSFNFQNNAGITRDNLMIRMKPEQWQQVIDVNLSGVFYASQEFIKQAIKSHNAGCIVNIASVVGQIGNPGQANYASAKAGKCIIVCEELFCVIG
jgi:3-oxoacyl-[acyl-carrier protein] reductase